MNYVYTTSLRSLLALLTLSYLLHIHEVLLYVARSTARALTGFHQSLQFRKTPESNRRPNAMGIYYKRVEIGS